MARRKIVLVTEAIHKAGLQLLAERYEVDVASDPSPVNLLRRVPQASALLVRSAAVPADLIAAATKLEVIARHGVAVDNIDVPAATRRGIPVAYTPGANAISVAEHVLALMGALAKRIVEYDAATRCGTFSVRESLRAMDLDGKVLGIVGMGRVGTVVGRKAKAAFNMRVLGYDPFVAPEILRSAGVEPADDLSALLRQSDIVTIHVPLTEGTRKLIGARELQRMKTTAFLINTARGAIVDEDALAEALREGRLAGAALDVFEQEPPDLSRPLFSAPNLVLTPHSAALTAECAERMAIQAAQAIVDVLEGRRPAAVVNPEVFSSCRQNK